MIDRYHGVEYLADDYVELMTPEARVATFDRLRALYPESIWVLRLEQLHSGSTRLDLELAVEIAQRFPLQTPFNYLDWARAALELGEEEQAVKAIQSGLEVFGKDSYPHGGEFRMTRVDYQDWLYEASAILAGTLSN